MREAQQPNNTVKALGRTSRTAKHLTTFIVIVNILPLIFSFFYSCILLHQALIHKHVLWIKFGITTMIRKH